MRLKTISECTALSFADTPFPVVAETLAAAGVAGYEADLIALRKTFYGGRAEHVDEALPLADAPEIAQGFDAAAVEAALRSVQQGEIGYAEFLRRIMRAGCARYSVFLSGRRAMYVGRDGEFYVEPFPQPAK